MKNRPFVLYALKGYFQRSVAVIALVILFHLVMFAVYGLYGIAWGPAFYTAILTGSLTLAAMIYGFYRYYQKLRRLGIIKKQAEVHLGEFPIAGDSIELDYQTALATMERRCQNTEAKARQDTVNATAYYTMWSHQIKTPIAAMRLLLQEEYPDKSAIEQELFKTEQYVEMVLQFQRLQGTSRDLVIKQHRLDTLVKQAVKRTSTLFIHKKIAIDLAPMELTTITDEKWLVFVLEQILTNAVKYTKQGGKVSIYLDESTPDTLVVEDTGMGIRPEDLPRVFDWGYTGYNGRLDKRSTGIGLCLCRQVMDLLGFSIRITSQIGQGTKVYLDLQRPTFEIE